MDEKQKIDETDKVEDAEKADKLESEAHVDKQAETRSTLTENDINKLIDSRLNAFMDKLVLNNNEPENPAQEKELDTNW